MYRIRKPCTQLITLVPLDGVELFHFLFIPPYLDLCQFFLTLSHPPPCFNLSHLPLRASLCLSLLNLVCVCVCVCVYKHYIPNRVKLKAWKQKAALSLKSNPMFYRVELLITDNPAASHLSFSLPVSHPPSSIVALLRLCLLTSYLSPFLIVLLVFLFSLSLSPSLFSFSQFSQESLHLVVVFGWSPLVCVCVLCW